MDVATMAKERGKIHARTHKITQRLAQFKNLLYLCTRNLIVCHNFKGTTKRPRRDGGAFFCFFFPFLCCKYNEKIKKIKKKSKKIKKNAKKFAYIKKMLYLCTEFEKQPQKVNQLKAKKL